MIQHLNGNAPNHAPGHDVASNDVAVQQLPAAYFQTRFRESDSDEEVRPTGETAPWPDSFAIITAYATTGQTWTAAENWQADHRLETELRSTRLPLRRLTGYCPGNGSSDVENGVGEHAEPGWAIEMDWQDACDLGRKYRQHAIFYVIGDLLHVTLCDDRRGLVPIGSFRERLDSD